MANTFADTWWHFDHYEVVLREGEHLPDLVIRPVVGARLQWYSVSELHRDLGPSRSAYLQLAHIGAELWDWFSAVPFDLIDTADCFRSVDNSFAYLDQLMGHGELCEKYGGAENIREQYRQWLQDALARGLHEPVIDWYQRFGLLGVPELSSKEVREAAGRTYFELEHLSRLDDAAVMAHDPEFWKTREESFPRFANCAADMHWVLRGLEHSDADVREWSLQGLNIYLESVGLAGVEVVGHIAPQWRSSSLLGMLGATALFDLAGGVRLGVCERCGTLFSTRRADKRTCSPRCQEAAKKKRRRGDPEYRAHELQRQRQARAREKHGGQPASHG
jgi:hypothetical protein